MGPEQAGNSDLVMPKISFGFNFGRDKIISRKYTYVVIDHLIVAGCLSILK